MPLVEVEALHAQYAVAPVLRGISFSVNAGEIVSIEHYCASAAYTTLFEQVGFTPDRVVAAAHPSLERAGLGTGTPTVRRLTSISTTAQAAATMAPANAASARITRL